MPTTRKINGYTILAIIPEFKTMFREFGEEPEEGIFYRVVLDNGVDEAVCAVVRNPLHDERWVSADYFHGDDMKKRRWEAFVTAIEAAGYRQALGESFVISNLAKVWGFDPKAV
jgi:hypothetical protein